MADIEVPVKFECSNCGPTTLNIEDELGDASPVHCATCGADFQTTWGEVQKSAVDKLAGDIFKGPGWKIT